VSAPAKPVRQPKAEEGPVRAATLLEERRRSQRVMVRMPINLHLAGRNDPIRGVTIAVSETGAMLMLSEPLAMGTKLEVENVKSQKRAHASVTRAPQVNNEGTLVPIEFVEPSPAFWNIFFPPPGN
jgi:hypothetical protein